MRRTSLGYVPLIAAGLMMAFCTSSAAQDRAIFDFDEDTLHPVELTGSGVTATVIRDASNPGARHTTTGFEGGAFEFDGIDDWIRIDLDANPIVSRYPQFTMGAFVRVDATPTDRVQSIISTDDGGWDRGIAIDHRLDGTPRWNAFEGGVLGGAIPGPIATPTSSWHLVAAVYDRFAFQEWPERLGTVRLYLDGKEVQAHASPGRSLDLIALARNPTFGEFFHGAIDNAFFFSGILSKSQLDTIRAGGKAALLATEPDNSERDRFLHDGSDPEPRAEDVILPAGNMNAHLRVRRSTRGHPRASPQWAFKTGEVPPGWAQPGFDDSRWSRGSGGFGHAWNAWEQDLVRTPWPATERDLFLRTTFILSAADMISRDGAPIALWGRWDDTLEVFINGVPGVMLDPALRDDVPDAPRDLDDPRGKDLRSLDGRLSPGSLPYAEGLVIPWQYRYVALTKEALQSLRVGANTIAVHVANLGNLGEFNPRYVDIGVVRNPFDGLPSTGFDTIPGSHQFLEAARAFAALHHIPTLSFIALRDGSVIAKHTIGHLDKERQHPAPLDTFFRVASMNKSVTAACIRRLVELGVVDPVTGIPLTLDAPYWPFLTGRGLTPLGGRPDPRAANITIQHLIEHSSGTPYGPGPDELREIFYNSMRFLDPESDRVFDAVTGYQLIRAIYGRELRFEPGDLTLPGDVRYSNEGYFLLNYLARVLTGDLESFLESHVVQAASEGIDPMILSTERLATRGDRETWYRTREWPWERWLIMEDAGNLSVTAESYLRFLSQRTFWGEPIPPAANETWGFGGEMPGTTTAVFQQVGTVQLDKSFVILTNQHDYLLTSLYVKFGQIFDTLP